MKQKLVRATRKVLPKPALKLLEIGYRRGRVHAQSLAYGYPTLGLKVIGVTGTNGKTTTVNFINEILKQAGYKTAMFSTAVIEIGGEKRANDLNMTVPDTGKLLHFFREARRAKADYVVLEVSSHALDQHKLDPVKFEAAVMTNLTRDHLDYHGTMEDYAAAKGKLFARQPKHVILNRDDEWFDFFNRYPASGAKMTYGKHPDAEAKIERVKLYKKGTEVDVVIDKQITLDLATALTGDYNASNLAAAASLCYLMGVSLEDIREGAANLEDIPGRYQRVADGLGFEVIVDYAHTPDGLEKVLRTARGLTKGRVILVLGIDGDRDKGKRPIMGEIAAKLADRIVLTDLESRYEEPAGIRKQLFEGIRAAAGGAAKTTEIADRREAIKRAISMATKDDTVIMTGLGHEQYRIIEGEQVAWNDADVAREILHELGRL